MKSTNYTEKVLDHFKNPRNVGTLEGESISSGRVGNPVCGDIMEIYIDVDEKDETIKDVKFQTFGCGSAVATSSMITEMALGKTVDEAYKISRKDVAGELEGLPPVKMHCSNLAADALQAAIRNYWDRTGKTKGGDSQKTPPDRLAHEDEHDHHHGHHKDFTPEKTGQTNAIKDELPYLGNGVAYSVKDEEEYRDRRVLVLFKGEHSVEIALRLTKVTGRVVLVTEHESLADILPDYHSKLKRSDVKLLGQSRLLEIMGEGDVEKVKILDLDEDNKYELFIDNVIIPEKVEIPNSCELEE